MENRKTDLLIYRGTYQECMAQETVDMKIYLAWDTGEIFIGNAVGKKIPYGNNQVFKKELTELTSSCIHYATGDEIETKIMNLGNNKSYFKPTLCTKTSTSGEYHSGNIYYFDYDSGDIRTNQNTISAS